MFISFLSQVEVGPLRNINFGIDYDAGNPFDTKITEPRVQTRLCLAEAKGVCLNTEFYCWQSFLRTAFLFVVVFPALFYTLCMFR